MYSIDTFQDEDNILDRKTNFYEKEEQRKFFLRGKLIEKLFVRKETTFQIKFKNKQKSRIYIMTN